MDYLKLKRKFRKIRFNQNQFANLGIVDRNERYATPDLIKNFDIIKTVNGNFYLIDDITIEYVNDKSEDESLSNLKYTFHIDDDINWFDIIKIPYDAQFEVYCLVDKE
jgi:hypothetical protein